MTNQAAIAISSAIITLAGAVLIAFGGLRGEAGVPLLLGGIMIGLIGISVWISSVSSMQRGNRTHRPEHRHLQPLERDSPPSH